MRAARAGSGLSDELVICTLDRPDDLARCLESVAQQSRMPDSVRVVDASADDRTRKVVRQVPQVLGMRITYQRTERGLTLQRNAGVRAGDSDVVHFVDDDTVLDASYFEVLIGLFERDADGSLLGAGGLVTNMHRHRVSLAKRLFMLDSPTVGRVLPSGRNPLVLDVDAETEVEWLSGCSMSFRRSVFDLYCFNEDFAGGGLGEDVEFGYRVSRGGRLVVSPAARLQHLQSPHNRASLPEYTFEELVNRARRVRARVGRLRMRWYWWSVVGQVLALCGAAAVSRSPVARERLKRAGAAVRVVLRESSSHAAGGA